MTIAQNLEQLLGKTAALSGAIGDGTAFMNDGSPQEEIGGILEQLGYEKYGNEVMYNGATGEQIEAAIFIGPVYGMRLKHMVEDKWQARGKGRKEVRTHQPTGGRGAQGGLKIGEMDRDAIIAHGGMAFVKESFMERSDGAKIPVCVACGTTPIYNPRLKLAICPLCDGPVQFTGDNVNNLEVVPPLGRPKSRIVEVEIPYSTNLLVRESEAYLNMTMRYITTSGVTRLTPLEYSGKASEGAKELRALLQPEAVVPAYINESSQEVVMTVEQLRALGMTVQQLTEEEKRALDTVLEESKEGELVQQQLQMDTAAAAAAAAPQAPMMGGLLAPSLATTLPMKDEQIAGAPMPGMGPVITVRTDAGAMMADGILPGPMGNGRAVRRNNFRYGGGIMDGGMMNGGMMSIHRMDAMDSMDSMMMPRGSGFGVPSPAGPPAQHNAPVFVNKME